MTGIILGIRKGAHEAPYLFVRRKNQLILSEIRDKQRWNVIWVQRVVALNDHVQRNTADACWSARISVFRNAADLAARRFEDAGGRPRV